MDAISRKPGIFDVIVVGAGPAGLNAALVLGRCRRRVLVIDDGKPRNAVSHALHGFLGHDCVEPARLRELAREQMAPYTSVVFEAARAIGAQRTADGFSVETDNGRRFDARKLLLAAGVKDELPDIAGLREMYGISVFHCPYCDGWEVRDKPLVAYGRGDEKGAGLALELTIWSRDVVLCTDGPGELSSESRERLRRYGINVREERITRIDAHGDVPYESSFDLAFEEGPDLRRTALFFNTGRTQSTDLCARLGSRLYEPEGCTVDPLTQCTDIPGLYVAGDASRDVLQVVVAAAEGSQAAIAINTALFKEDLE